MNCDLLQPDKNASTAKLLDIFDFYLLKQHIQSPTRVTLNSQILIDVIISSIEDNKTIEAGVVELGISDHNLVYICRKVSVPKKPPKIIFSRQFKNFRVNEFRTNLRNIFASNIITDDPNNMWYDWKNKFLHVAERHAPTRQRRVKSDYKPWLTEHIKKQCYHIGTSLRSKQLNLNLHITIRLTKGIKIMLIALLWQADCSNIH